MHLVALTNEKQTTATRPNISSYTGKSKLININSGFFVCFHIPYNLSNFYFTSIECMLNNDCNYTGIILEGNWTMPLKYDFNTHFMLSVNKSHE